MKNICLRNVNNIIIAQININSFRNKFDLLSHYVCDNIDIFIITETKLDKSFPSGQFLLRGYSEPFRLDRNQFGGGLLVFLREDIPCSIQLIIEALFIDIFIITETKIGLLVFLREDIPCSIVNIKQLIIEALFIEINLRKKSGCYVAHTTLIKT